MVVISLLIGEFAYFDLEQVQNPHSSHTFSNDGVTITYSGAAYDGNGNTYDVQIIVKNITVYGIKGYSSHNSKYMRFFRFNSSPAPCLIACGSDFNQNGVATEEYVGSVDYEIEIKIVNGSGTFLFCMHDIDRKRGSYYGDTSEGVNIGIGNSGFDTGTICVQPNSTLAIKSSGSVLRIVGTAYDENTSRSQFSIIGSAASSTFHWTSESFSASPLCDFGNPSLIVSFLASGGDKVYNGFTQSGVTPNVGYTLSGTYEAVNANINNESYTAYVNLARSTDVWADTGTRETRTVTWRIVPYPLYVSWTGETSWMYDGQPHSPTPTITTYDGQTHNIGDISGMPNMPSNMPAGARDETLHFVCTDASQTAAGRYNYTIDFVVWNGRGIKSNYSISNNQKPYEITRIKVTLPSTDNMTYKAEFQGINSTVGCYFSKVSYGFHNANLSSTSSAQINETVGYYYSPSFMYAKDAGSYSVEASLINDNYEWATDGTLTPKTINWKINQRELTITWTGAREWVYDGQPHSPTPNDILNMPGPNIINEKIVFTPVQKINVGVYYATATWVVEGGRKKSSNYKITNSSPRFEIKRKPIPLITPTSTDYTYNGKPQGVVNGEGYIFSQATIPTIGTWYSSQGSVTGEPYGGENGYLFSTNLVTTTDARDSACTVIATPDSNHKWSDNGANELAGRTITFRVNRKSVTLAWESQSTFVYNATRQGPKLQNNPLTNMPGPYNTGKTNETLTFVVSDGLNAGTYDSSDKTAEYSRAYIKSWSVTGGRERKNNYTITNLTTTKDFIIKRKPIPYPDNVELVYSGVLQGIRNDGPQHDRGYTFTQATIGSHTWDKNQGTVQGKDYYFSEEIIKAIDAGEYPVTAIPDRNHEWRDATTQTAKEGAYSFTWKILPYPIEIIWENKDSFLFDGVPHSGNPQAPQIVQVRVNLGTSSAKTVDVSAVDSSGRVSVSAMPDIESKNEIVYIERTAESNANMNQYEHYMTTASIYSVGGTGQGKISNYVLKSNTKSYQITPVLLRRTTLANTYTYNGLYQDAVLNDYDSMYMDILENSGRQIDADTYIIKIALKDNRNYNWDNNNNSKFGGTEQLNLEWIIHPFEITVNWQDVSELVFEGTPHNGIPQAPEVLNTVADGPNGEKVHIQRTIPGAIVGNYTSVASIYLVDGPGTHAEDLNNRGNPTRAILNYKLINEEKPYKIIEKLVNKPVSGDRVYIYNKKEQEFEIVGFDPVTMRISGNKQTNAGEYEVRVWLEDNHNYAWYNNRADKADLTWPFIILRAAAHINPSCRNSEPVEVGNPYAIKTEIINQNNVPVTNSNKGDEDYLSVRYTYDGDGKVSAVLSNTDVAEITLFDPANREIRIKRKSTLVYGDTTLTISADASGINYLATSDPVAISDLYRYHVDGNYIPKYNGPGIIASGLVNISVIDVVPKVLEFELDGGAKETKNFAVIGRIKVESENPITHYYFSENSEDTISINSDKWVSWNKWQPLNNMSEWQRNTEYIGYARYVFDNYENGAKTVYLWVKDSYDNVNTTTLSDNTEVDARYTAKVKCNQTTTSLYPFGTYFAIRQPGLVYTPWQTNDTYTGLFIGKPYIFKSKILHQDTGVERESEEFKYHTEINLDGEIVIRKYGDNGEVEATVYDWKEDPIN